MKTRNALPLAIAVPLLFGSASGLAAGLTDVPSANTRVDGQSRPNVLSPELAEQAVAAGSIGVENPSALVGFYGYDATSLDVSTQFVPSFGSNVEASKTEPDKNTYLLLDAQIGPDTDYDYGHHFLFQGHETGKTGYLTRVNLDADAAHRVTLMADQDVHGKQLPTFDGSTWNPFAKVLLLTAEAGASGGVWQATLDYPSQVTDISSALGRGGYEGIQTDRDGNVWIVEDVGGASGTGANNTARRPNSFIYRFVPNHPNELTRGGRLQALQVMKLGGDCQGAANPITYDATLNADQAAFVQDVSDLHTYGNAFCTRWVDLTLGASYNANAAAKAAGATPFKRPENGVFQPGTGFRSFYFTETGDTNMNSTANFGFGGYGAVFMLTQPGGPSADTGILRMFYLGDVAHSGFDNIAFAGATKLLVVEDAGDTLHRQRNALDSGYLFDTRVDYGTGAPPVRFLAEGRDASATLDALLSGSSGFQNEGDNEITGIHVSNGDPTVQGLLGARIPLPFALGWRVFYTQQHGDNNTWEIVPAPKDSNGFLGW
jgi:hypothetical protein